MGAKSSLNMEQVQVKSIMAFHLVFWVMLGVTRIRKYFPPSAAEFYRKAKLYKLKWSRLCPLLHEVVTQDTSSLLHHCHDPSCNIDYLKGTLKFNTCYTEKFLSSCITPDLLFEPNHRAYYVLWYSPPLTVCTLVIPYNDLKCLDLKWGFVLWK